jgi:uncharacterized protein
MHFGDMIARRPLTAAVLFEGGLLVLALALAYAFGLRPWDDLMPTWRLIGLVLAATAPPVVLLIAFVHAGYGWMRELEHLTHATLDVLFRERRTGSVLLVALAAGFGEEFLFRGVLQAGLIGLTGPAVAIAIASIVFGLAHALSLAYFVAATVIGVYLGALYHVTGSLLLVCLVHALYDWAGIHYYLWRRRRHADAAQRTIVT